MKKFNLSVVAVLAMSTFAVAGGDIVPVEPVVETPVVVEAPDTDAGFYVGIAYGMANASADYSGDYDEGEYWGDYSGEAETDWDTVMLQAGYKINNYIAVEGRYWSSFGDADWSDKGSGWDSDWDDHSWDNSGTEDSDFTAWGIYVKPMYPVTEAFDIYALLGYGNVEINNGDESGFQWGIGAALSLTENVSVFVDYVNMYNDDGVDTYYNEYFEADVTEEWDMTIYTVNFGLSYKF